MDDNQRQKLEDAALSPEVGVSAMGFLMMQIAFEDGKFDRDRIKELYNTKAAIVAPKDMQLVIQTYRSLLKVGSLDGKLPTFASTSGKWGEFTANDEKLALGALAGLASTPSGPGTTGHPLAMAASLARALSPMPSMAFTGGPMNLIPSDSRASAK